MTGSAEICRGMFYNMSFGLFDYDIKDLKGPGSTFSIGDISHHNKGIVGGGMLVNEFTRLPYSFSGVRPPWTKRWGKEDKDFQVKYFRRLSGMRGPVQEMPVFESRVSIDPIVKDYWGIPVLAVSGKPHPLDYDHSEWHCKIAEDILIEAGAFKTWRYNTARKNQPSGGQHQAGTARMGNDPKTSVVNRYGQVHDVDNLFVADASVFVTNGGFNPVLTIMAVSYWVSDYIVKNWKGTKFK